MRCTCDANIWFAFQIKIDCHEYILSISFADDCIFHPFEIGKKILLIYFLRCTAIHQYSDITKHWIRNIFYGISRGVERKWKFQEYFIPYQLEIWSHFKIQLNWKEDIAIKARCWNFISITVILFKQSWSIFIDMKSYITLQNIL